MPRRPPIVDKRGIFGHYPGQKRRVLQPGQSFFTGLPIPKSPTAAASGISAPGAPGTPSPGAPDTPAATPWDTLVERRKASAGNQYGQDIAGIDAAELQAKQGYGIEDASDPFSRAAMLQRAYQQGQAGTNTSYAARGQLYAGSLTNALDTGTYNYQQSSDALKKDYQGVLQGLTEKRQQAQRARDAGIEGADWQALQLALGTTPEPQAEKPQSTLARILKKPVAKRPAGVYPGAPPTIVSSKGTRKRRFK